MLGKNRRKKVRKKVFLYSHEYRDQKMWGKKRAKQFFQKHTNSARKKYWEKNRRKKVRKTFFYIHTNIVTKKWGGKLAKQFFQNHRYSVRKKSSEKRAKKLFFIFTRIS